MAIAGIDFRLRAHRRLACVAICLGYYLFTSVVRLIVALGLPILAMATLPWAPPRVGGSVVFSSLFVDDLSTGLMLGYVLLAVTLPHALIAWQDPDYLEADSPA